MPKIETLKLNKDFKRLYGRGKSFVHPVLVTYVMKSRTGYCRVGVTTGKKVGNAVQRNRARRIILAAYRELVPEISGGFDIVFVARSKTPFVKSTDIYRVLAKQLKEAGAIKCEMVTD